MMKILLTRTGLLQTRPVWWYSGGTRGHGGCGSSNSGRRKGSARRRRKRLSNRNDVRIKLGTCEGTYLAVGIFGIANFAPNADFFKFTKINKNTKNKTESMDYSLHNSCKCSKLKGICFITKILPQLVFSAECSMVFVKGGTPIQTDDSWDSCQEWFVPNISC